MQMYYDPCEAPHPEEWLMLDESERITLVRAYHQRAGIEVPNPLLHAAIHATVENQVALGEELSVRSKLAALMKEGLDRHEAVHAIGSILAEFIYESLKGDRPGDDVNEQYLQAVSELTAESWRASSENRQYRFHRKLEPVEQTIHHWKQIRLRPPENKKVICANPVCDPRVAGGPFLHQSKLQPRRL